MERKRENKMKILLFLYAFMIRREKGQSNFLFVKKMAKRFNRRNVISIKISQNRFSIMFPLQ